MPIKIIRNDITKIECDAVVNAANITGKLFEHSFEMRFGKSDIIEMAHPFRPYIIDKNGVQNGIVYQTKFNGGLFKKFDYHQMKKAGITYDLFPIGLGTDGSKSPIYQDNSQIAQIEKDCVVYNDLHTYKIFAQDEFSGEIAVLFAESELEEAIIELFKNEGYSYQNGEYMHREYDEILLVDEVRSFLTKKYSELIQQL